MPNVVRLKQHLNFNQGGQAANACPHCADSLPYIRPGGTHLEINSLGRLHSAHGERTTRCTSVQFGHILFQSLSLHFIYLCFPHFDSATGWQLRSGSRKKEARKKEKLTNTELLTSATVQVAPIEPSAFTRKSMPKRLPPPAANGKKHARLKINKKRTLSTHKG